MSDAHRPRLVVVLGVAPRSGTNFAGDLLDLHDDVELLRSPPEDGLLRSAGDLVAYQRSVVAFYRRWPDRHGIDDDEILAAVGSGLEAWLRRRAGVDEATTLVAKTPFPDNLALAPRLFPGRPVVVVVRDGRDVAESARRTWGTPLDVAIEQWVDGVRAVRDALDAPAVGATTTIVRYEDLLADRQAVLADLFTTIGLDPARFAVERAENLAVRGSSTHRPDGGEVSWQPLDAAGFQGTDRWTTWSPSEVDMFHRMASDEMRWAGYELDTPTADRRWIHLGDMGRAARRRVWRRLPDGVRDRVRGARRDHRSR